MTRPIGTVDRIRWMAALLASAALTMVVAFGLHHWQFSAGQGGAPAPATASAGSSSPLDPRIASLAAHHPQRVIEAIVQFKPTVSPERARWDVSRVQGHVFGELQIINALAVKLTAERARWLAANQDVHAVSLNAVIKTQGGPGVGGRGGSAGPGGPAANGLAHRHGHGPSQSNPQNTYDQTLDATGLWSQGINGQGVGVAVLDTGIDGDLPDFQGAGGSRVIATAVTNPDATTATDGYGHGTDVAGIIAGDGNNLPDSDPLKGAYTGVAPGANLVSIKVSDDQGNATVLDVIYGLQFAIDHQSDYNIRVVNMSLDSSTPQSYRTDPLDAAAEAAWNHGIVVVAAAGNRGTAADAVQYAPANDPYVITVGGADENGTADPGDDVVASWSSRGTTQDGFQKPDLYAPGAHIISVLAPNSLFARECLPCQIGGQYIRTSGTSMAAPVISGLVADLVQAHPSWTPDQVKGALTSSAVDSNSLPEVDAVKVAALGSPPEADAGLTPNQLIDPTTGGIDYARSTWSRSTWSIATGALSAAFARSSWSCTCSSALSSTSNSGSVDSTRSTWSRSTWSTYVRANR
jgi:serine protease AprX